MDQDDDDDDNLLTVSRNCRPILEHQLVNISLFSRLRMKENLFVFRLEEH